MQSLLIVCSQHFTNVQLYFIFLYLFSATEGSKLFLTEGIVSSLQTVTIEVVEQQNK